MSKKRNHDAIKSEGPVEDAVGRVREDLDLSQLDTDVMGFNGRAAAEGFQERQAVRDAKKAEFKAKYGDAWWPHYANWLRGSPGYNEMTKLMNEQLYRGSLYSPLGSGAVEARERMRRHMMEVYGDAWQRLSIHDFADPEAVELLLRWAERTGNWKELPDALQGEYHRRVASR